MSGEQDRTLPDRFDFLATAVSGRHLQVRFDAAGEYACCDGCTVYLPSSRLSDEADDVWRDVVAQAVLLALDSLQPRIVRALIGRPQVARRYAFIEIRRGSRLPGARLPLTFALEPALRASEGWPLSDSAEASYRLACELRHRDDEIPAFVGTVRPLLVLRQRRDGGREGASAPTAAQAAGRFADLDGIPAFGDEDETGTSWFLGMLKNTFGGANPLGQALGKLFGQGRSRGQAKDAPGGGELPVGRIEQVWRKGLNAVRAVDPGVAADSPVPMRTSVLARRFPEWDCHRGRYREDWVTVEQVEPWRDAGAPAFSGGQEAAGGGLRRRLAALGLEYELCGHQREGVEFDFGALIDHGIDLRSGHSAATPYIYRASRRTRRDLGVFVAVDVSGSMGENNGHGQLFDLQLHAAWQLAHALDALGDRVAFYGFQSWGRDNVAMLRLKGHEERWTGLVAERMARLQPAGYTRTGSVVRFAEAVLSNAMRLPNRLLILVTDGIAYDLDYEGRYAEQDTRKALTAARSAGVACVCLCIGGAADEARLTEVFGAADLLIADDSGTWRTRIGEVCRRSLFAVRRMKAAAPRRLGARVRPAAMQEGGG